MTRRVRPRRGVSLTEVLVAMFMMAVGMIAIFTLFPLGAMQVGQALRDDRTTQTAQQADGYMRDLWRHHVAAELTEKREPTDPFYWAMNDPNQYSAPPTTSFTPKNMARTPKRLQSADVYGNSFLPTNQQLPTENNAPRTTVDQPISPTMLTQDKVTNPPSTTTVSTPADDPNLGTTYSNATFRGSDYPARLPTYPVLVDPLGFAYRTGQDQPWVSRTAAASGASRLLLPRRQVNAVFTTPAVTQQQFALQIAGMMDDVIFDPNGMPPTGSGEMVRQGRYSWAAIVQRPDASRKDVANLTILTFDGRSRLPAITAPQGSTQQPYNDELVVAPEFSQSKFDRQVTVRLPVRGADDPVLARRGGWVMDGTIDSLPFTAIPGVLDAPRRHAFFYRITGWADNADGTTTLDLETPLQASVFAAPTTTRDPAASQLYFFAGLAEVFPRAQLRSDFNY